MDFLKEALTQLAINSPYAVILIANMWFYNNLNNKSLNQLQVMFDSAVKSMQESHNAAFIESRKTLDLIVDFNNKLQEKTVKKDQKNRKEI